MTDAPLTRWEQGGASSTGYAARFGELIAQGSDIDGEARLADVLVERGALILDAGAGMGRVGAALAARGHRVTAAEKDGELVTESRRRYPDLPVVQSDLYDLTPDVLAAAGQPTDFDLIVVVGNVLVLLAPATERQVLARLRDLLAPGGRILVGFHHRNGHGNAREYPFSEFAEDVAAAGLAVQQHFSTYQLAPAEDDADYAVVVLARA
jgi:SAM-dependent methyltransferase